ncbi:MAG: hypothetical protein WBB15_14325, partial [Ornithinimicrobium sp.]
AAIGHCCGSGDRTLLRERRSDTAAVAAIGHCCGDRTSSPQPPGGISLVRTTHRPDATLCSSMVTAALGLYIALGEIDRLIGRRRAPTASPSV